MWCCKVAEQLRGLEVAVLSPDFLQRTACSHRRLKLTEYLILMFAGLITRVSRVVDGEDGLGRSAGLITCVSS